MDLFVCYIPFILWFCCCSLSSFQMCLGILFSSFPNSSHFLLIVWILLCCGSPHLWFNRPVWRFQVTDYQFLLLWLWSILCFGSLPHPFSECVHRTSAISSLLRQADYIFRSIKLYCPSGVLIGLNILRKIFISLFPDFQFHSASER